jgi:hypothetical protein
VIICKEDYGITSDWIAKPDWDKILIRNDIVMGAAAGKAQHAYDSRLFRFAKEKRTEELSMKDKK